MLSGRESIDSQIKQLEQNPNQDVIDKGLTFFYQSRNDFDLQGLIPEKILQGLRHAEDSAVEWLIGRLEGMLLIQDIREYEENIKKAKLNIIYVDQVDNNVLNPYLVLGIPYTSTTEEEVKKQARLAMKKLALFTTISGSNDGRHVGSRSPVFDRLGLTNDWLSRAEEVSREVSRAMSLLTNYKKKEKVDKILKGYEGGKLIFREYKEKIEKAIRESDFSSLKDIITEMYNKRTENPNWLPAELEEQLLKMIDDFMEELKRDVGFEEENKRYNRKKDANNREKHKAASTDQNKEDKQQPKPYTSEFEIFKGKIDEERGLVGLGYIRFSIKQNPLLREDQKMSLLQKIEVLEKGRSFN